MDIFPEFHQTPMEAMVSFADGVALQAHGLPGNHWKWPNLDSIPPPLAISADERQALALELGISAEGAAKLHRLPCLTMPRHPITNYYMAWLAEHPLPNETKYTTEVVSFDTYTRQFGIVACTNMLISLLKNGHPSPSWTFAISQ